MRKKFFIITVMIISFIAIGCTGNKNVVIPDNKAAKLNYDIISKAELGSSVLQDWYEKSYGKLGYHYINDEKGNNFILISAGERPTGGYILKLASVEEDAESVTFYAELEYPQKGQMVTEALTYPHLLIKTNYDKKRIDAQMKNVEETHLNLTGTYIGRIDSNSVEIKLDNPDFVRKNWQAFRLNDETRNWFDLNNPQTNYRIKFDVLKDSNGQLTILKIKASGDKVEEVIAGDFVGQIDNNFIEVRINGEPKSFKLSEEFKKNFDSKMYEKQKVAMLCLKDKTYSYIVLDMKPLEYTEKISQGSNGSVRLTLQALKNLAKKGDQLSLKDLEMYQGREIGSGLYIMEYSIEDKYVLLIGASSPHGKLLYVSLINKDLKDQKGIDIRYEDIDKFIGTK